jgi:hypothetical protein
MITILGGPFPCANSGAGKQQIQRASPIVLMLKRRNHSGIRTAFMCLRIIRSCSLMVLGGRLTVVMRPAPRLLYLSLLNFRLIRDPPSPRLRRGKQRAEVGGQKTAAESESRLQRCRFWDSVNPGALPQVRHGKSVLWRNGGEMLHLWS